LGIYVPSIDVRKTRNVSFYLFI